GFGGRHDLCKVSRFCDTRFLNRRQRVGRALKRRWLRVGGRGVSLRGGRNHGLNHQWHGLGYRRNRFVEGYRFGDDGRGGGRGNRYSARPLFCVVVGVSEVVVLVVGLSVQRLTVFGAAATAAAATAAALALWLTLGLFCIDFGQLGVLQIKF